MKTSFVLLLIGAAILAVVGGSAMNREVRQTWSFPEDQSTETIPLRPSSTTTTRRTTTTRASSPQQPPASSSPQPPAGVSTSTQPTGVIFQVKDCPCPAPPQFNPVCGTDGNTYVNRQKLACAQRCGFNVQEARMGSC